MNILLAGCSGFVGNHLKSFLVSRGHSITSLVRRKPLQDQEIYWKPSENVLEPQALESFDAVIHLGGVNVASKRWTPEYKALMESSRVKSTFLLASTMAKLQSPPSHFLCASAIGFYGNRGDEILDESSVPGQGFLPDLCQKWEEACTPARQAGINVTNCRIGIVLGDEGAVAKMKLPFSLGLGGYLGSGSQYWSWIAIEDAVRAISFCLEQSLTGPVNIVGPAPVTNREFSQSLAKAMKRPCLFPAPAFALRLLLGEFADEGLLASTRVLPKKLEEAGFRFNNSELRSALTSALIQED